MSKPFVYFLFPASYSSPEIYLSEDPLNSDFSKSSAKQSGIHTKTDHCSLIPLCINMYVKCLDFDLTEYLTENL